MTTKSKKASSSKKAASSKKATATVEPEKLAASLIPRSVRLVDFDRAEVRPGFVPGTYILTVVGIKPYFNMQVHLSPLIYIRQPEYWGIEVIGTLSTIGLPMKAPYVAVIPLEGITGTKGIEVIGAKRKKKIDVPPRPVK